MIENMPFTYYRNHKLFRVLCYAGNRFLGIEFELSKADIVMNWRIGTFVPKRKPYTRFYSMIPCNVCRDLIEDHNLYDDDLNIDFNDAGFDYALKNFYKMVDSEDVRFVVNVSSYGV